MLKGVLHKPSISSFVDNYFAQGGSAGAILNGDNSSYAPGQWVNAISLPGIITINLSDVTATANANPNIGSWYGAYISIILHELGHAFYATAMAGGYTTVPAERLEWCYNREAYASMFVYDFIVNNGYVQDELIVPGPGIPGDLYPILAAAVAGEVVGSKKYKDKLLAAARAKFSTNKRYREICTKFAYGQGLPPAYFPPVIPDSSGHTPGGVVPMPIPYVALIPKVYAIWNPPNVSN